MSDFCAFEHMEYTSDIFLNKLFQVTSHICDTLFKNTHYSLKLTFVRDYGKILDGESVTKYLHLPVFNVFFICQVTFSTNSNNVYCIHDFFLFILCVFIRF